MTTVMPAKEPPPGGLGSITLGSVALRLIGLMLFWAGASWLAINMFADGYWQFASIIIFITLVVTVIWLRPSAYPLRWMSPGLAFMLLISVYPIMYSIYISFTNFGTGHILPKVQTVEVLQQRRFLPEEAATYAYTLFQNEDGDYALLLQLEEGATPFAVISGSIAELATAVAADSEVDSITLAGQSSPYTLVPTNRLFVAITELQEVDFGSGEATVRIQGTNEAAALEARYEYDETADTILDRRDGVLYRADDTVGAFVANDGTELLPGYTTEVGLFNYIRFTNNPAFRGPLLQIFIWTIVYAAISTVFSFSLGLLIAIAFGRDLPGQKIIKSLLLIPFAIPGVISVLVWRGLFNPIQGPVALFLSSIIGDTVNVFASPTGVKIALVLVNLWLAYPYYVLINSGALQAIPTDMYEAADIDGASWWHQFRYLTLPLLLVGVGPLLIGSFMVNFNSFNLIYLFNDGGPHCRYTHTGWSL